MAVQDEENTLFLEKKQENRGPRSKDHTASVQSAEDDLWPYTRLRKSRRGFRFRITADFAMTAKVLITFNPYAGSL
jgi:hypothetical protein